MSLAVLEETDATQNYWCRVRTKNVAAEMEIRFILNMRVDKIQLNAFWDRDVPNFILK